MATTGQRPLRATERLKQARESRGLSLRQLADVTKVSTRVVAALEDGRMDVVPAGVYRRSLVRLVAAEVGLPPEETLRAFLAEHPDDLPLPADAVAAEPPTRTPVTRLLKRALTMIGALVPLLVGVAYFAKPIVESRPAVVTLDASREDASAWRPEIVPAGGFTEAPPPAARPAVLFLTVSRDCVLQVVADGGLVVGRPFSAGESMRVAFSDAVELSGDNAGAVQFSINGQAGLRLGEDGALLSVRIGRDDYTRFLSGR